MKAFHGRVGLMAGFLAASVLVACGTENGIVGGDCAPGYVLCGGACELASACDVPNAPSNDNGNGNGNGNGPTLTDGGPTNEGDATASNDASPSDDASTDAGAPDGATQEPDANVCAPPTLDCGSGCVDIRTSVEHCGACNAFCAAGRCIEGVCEGAVAGHAVLIGHDYVSPLSPSGALSSQERLLGNAALLAPARTLRVVTVETYADPTAAINVRSILMRAAAETARPLYFRTTDDVTTVERADTDVLLIHDQIAAAGRFSARASAARDPLDRFLTKSGVVIVLDGASAGTEMVTFARDAGLFAVQGHATPSGPFFVDARDGIAYGVSSPYAALAHTTGFSFGGPPPSALSITVADANGTPIVLHGTR